MITVSIIVPVYNVGEYLLPCLDSLAAQSFRDWECILVDDGSTDGSGEVCDRYAAGDSRFRVVHQPNSGVAAARAAGVRQAAGEYLWFVDGDDLAHPRFLEEMTTAVHSGDFPILGCRVVPFYGNPPQPGDAGSCQVWAGEEAIHHLLHDKALDYGLYNRLFRRDVMTPEFLDNGFKYNEDLLANWYALERAGKMAFLDFGGYFYRQVEGSASRKKLTVPFITQQWQVAGLIARDRREDTIRSFYYEKLLYLYSMILRQDHWQEFSYLGSTLQGFIRKEFSTSLGYKTLPLGMKLAACLSLLPPVWYRGICRALLKDRR